MIVPSANRRPLRVCHVINALYVGGAEAMLVKLLGQLDPADVHSHVVTLLDGGPLAGTIRGLGIPVDSANISKRGLGPARLRHLPALIRDANPDVVQTWLYHGDLIGGLAAKFTRRDLPVLWNLRHSDLSGGVDRATTRWTVRACAKLSAHLPARIVVNSEAGQRVHAELGYDPSRLVVIPNGFDLSAFRPSTTARSRLRQELGLSETTQIVGLIARWHPQKDHANFIAAAARIAAAANPEDVAFVLCGDRVHASNADLQALIARTGFPERFHLLGRRSDVARIQAALDVGVSSSVCGEGFPNVIGEAMACGVPCVVTDVGGSAEVVGDTGRVVPPNRPDDLADACLELLRYDDATRAALGLCARQRVVDHFSLPRIAARYLEEWRAAAGWSSIEATESTKRAA